MALITLRDVTVAFGGPPLLDAVDLTIARRERVCLVGRNGAGKTTLLELIAGGLLPDSGEIELGKGVRVRALAQAVPNDMEGTCAAVTAGGLDAEGGAEAGHRVEAVLSRLGLDPLRDTATMSGGMKRRVMLARALVAEPDLLLLDEPTNHLDIDSIRWLEEFLVKYDKAVLFITHDRVFLQRLATRIVDLDCGRLTSYPGDYRSYLDRKEKDLEAEAGQQARFDRKLAVEEAWIRQGVRARRTRNEGRVRALLRMREEARERRAAPGAARITVSAAGRSGKKVVEARGVSFGYPGGDRLISGLAATVFRGDKVAVIGPNGCGKTTLLRLMLGGLEPVEGEVRLGDNIEVAYLDQLRDQLDPQRTVLENIVEAGDKVFVDGKPRHVIGYLKDFLFSGERARTPVWVLSGGERNRLLLAKLFTRPSNVLVLDEPTNDLDAETLDLLEECVLGYAGTVLFASHDRAFIDNVATCTLAFEGDGRVSEQVGGYGEWLAQRAAPGGVARAEGETAAAKEKRRRERPGGPRKLTYAEGIELGALPGAIEALEEELARVHAALSDPDLYKRGADDARSLRDALARLEGELHAAYDRWSELEAVREAYENG
jgi:ATP-binding cassette subfamily F protein uup